MDCPSYICKYFYKKDPEVRICWDGHLKQFGIVKLHRERELGNPKNLMVSGYLYDARRGPLYSGDGRANHKDFPADKVPVVKSLFAPEDFIVGTKYQTIEWKTTKEQDLERRAAVAAQDREYKQQAEELSTQHAEQIRRWADKNDVADHTTTTAERVALREGIEKEMNENDYLGTYTQRRLGYVE